MKITMATITLFACALLLHSGSASAADDNGEQTSCAENADNMAGRVKQALTPHYAATDSKDSLDAALRSVEGLLLEAGHCATSARSHGTQVGDRQRNIMEWHSMNQWLGRLSGALNLSAAGHTDGDWRAEYELFADVYEFEP